jgi:hypothetical protein
MRENNTSRFLQMPEQIGEWRDMSISSGRKARMDET